MVNKDDHILHSLCLLHCLQYNIASHVAATLRHRLVRRRRYGDGYIYAVSPDAKTIALIPLSDNFTARLASPTLAGRRL